jgi:NitT/TauT family transport system substrate-binding protein
MCRLSVSLLIAVFLSFPAAARGAPDEPVQVTIAEYGEFLLYVPLYVADARKYFVEEGLSVTIVPAGGDEKVFAALLSGEAQFGVGDPALAAIAGERGNPGRVILSLLQSVPAFGVARRKEVPRINDPRQLGPFTVATYPAPSTAYTLQKKMFLSGGLEPNIRELPYGSLLGALEAGTIDIALEYEPNVSLAVDSGAREVFSLATYYPDFALTGLTVLPEYLAKHEVEARAVIRSLQRAMRFIAADLTGTVGILHQRFPNYPAPIIRRAVESSMRVRALPSDGVMRESAWKAAIELRRSVGDLKGDAPFYEYVINRFAEETLRAGTK